LRIQATQAAGARPLVLADTGAAIEVMTGAVLPVGTDCVIPMEEYVTADDGVALHANAVARPWRNVQRRGADGPSGGPMLEAGIRLGAAEIAVAASAGQADLQVGRLPRVAVISNGDELVDPGRPLADYQIRRSNAPGIVAALLSHGLHCVDDDHLRDDGPALREGVARYLDSHDVLILSGGVSKGKFDLVPQTLKSLGVTEVFHQVEQRPGRPLWFGIGPRRQLVFGLPGNPVATLVCFARYVVPALRAASGAHRVAPERLALAGALRGRSITYFMPVVCNRGTGLPGSVAARTPSGSGDFLALAGTDGFVELPPQPQGYPAGFVADFHRW
jgi:molybdopterin molybdotransferase